MAILIASVSTKDGRSGGSTSGGSQGASSTRVPLGARQLRCATGDRGRVAAEQAQHARRSSFAPLQADTKAVTRDHDDRRVVGGRTGRDPEAEPVREEGQRLVELRARQHDLGRLDIGRACHGVSSKARRHAPLAPSIRLSRRLCWPSSLVDQSTSVEVPCQKRLKVKETLPMSISSPSTRPDGSPRSPRR